MSHGRMSLRSKDIIELRTVSDPSMHSNMLSRITLEVFQVGGDF